MGLFEKLLKKQDAGAKIDSEFLSIVRARDNGEEWAQSKINQMWDNNDSYLTEKMAKARIQIYTEPARQGDKRARYWLGWALQFYDIVESRRLLEGLASEGNIAAMNTLASCYTQYGGYGDNEEMCRYWHLQAAKAGDSHAQARVGLDYICDGDYNSAKEWYKLSADQNNSEGLLGYAKCLEYDKDNLCMVSGSDMSDEQKKKIKNQYDWDIENVLINAMNYAANMDESANAASALSYFYERVYQFENKVVNIANRMAYFTWIAYLYGNELMKDRFYEFVNVNNIHVDTNNIEDWAESVKVFG